MPSPPRPRPIAIALIAGTTTGGVFFSLIMFNDALLPLISALGTTPLMLAVIVGAAQNIGVLPQTVTVEVDNAMDTGGAVYPKATVIFLKQLPTLPVGRPKRGFQGGDVQAMRKQGEDIFDICQRQKVAHPARYRAMPCFVYKEDPLRQWKPHALPAVAALTPDEAMRCADATARAKKNYFPLVQLQCTRFEGFFTVTYASYRPRHPAITSFVDRTDTRRFQQLQGRDAPADPPE